MAVNGREWDAHHCLPKARLKREGISVVIPDTAVVVLTNIHEKHTVRYERIPYDVLPPYVIAYAASLGTWAEDALLREHPKML